MKRYLIFLLGVAFVVSVLAAAPLQKDDAKCKDHPLFTRMPTYWIHSCIEKQFDAHDFITAMTKGKPTTEHVEGHLWKINYYPQATATQKPSDLQIIRNYENAVRNIGGTVVWSDKSRATFKLLKDGKEIWVNLWAEFTGKYGFTIVQREAMKQEVQANAEVFQSDIRSTGHAAVYGITFDTDSASIKPESAQAIGEVAKLLKADPGLKVFVVGHTDNSGSVDHNLKLSQDRAQSVMQALVRDHGIAAARLRSYGCGPYAPVASNDSEDGKAKNRRVELVKQ
jgi:outer membrane protein OmpA-like peptidoglycan-associated protein